MLLPVLIIFVWIYLRLRPTAARRRALAVFDCAVITIALALSAWGLLWVKGLDVGAASAVWKPVLSVISTFHIFPFVLCFGWWVRRRWFDAGV